MILMKADIYCKLYNTCCCSLSSYGIPPPCTNNVCNKHPSAPLFSFFLYPRVLSPFLSRFSPLFDCCIGMVASSAFSPSASRDQQFLPLRAPHQVSCDPPLPPNAAAAVCSAAWSSDKAGSNNTITQRESSPASSVDDRANARSGGCVRRGSAIAERRDCGGVVGGWHRVVG